MADASAARSEHPELTEKALIADIPPAMLAKLQLNGQLLGYLILFLALTIVPTLGLVDPLAAKIAEVLQLGHDGPRRVADFALLFGIFTGCLSLPWYFKRSEVQGELRYRRQHGKWRWER